jgi:hypothetical protein
MFQCCQRREIMEFRKLIESSICLNPFKDLEPREDKMEIRPAFSPARPYESFIFNRGRPEYSAKQPVPSSDASRGNGVFCHALSEYFSFGLNKTPINLDKENVDVFTFHILWCDFGKNCFERTGDRSGTVLTTGKCGKCQLVREDTYGEDLFVGTEGESRLRETWQTDC